MSFDFEEVELIKNVFKNCNENIKKESILIHLENIKENTEDKELNRILESTFEKLNIMSDIEVEKTLRRIFSDELFI